MSRAISLFLAICLLLPIIGCTQQGETDSDSTDDSALSSDNMLTIVENGVTEYVIVRSDFSSKVVTNAAVRLRKTINEQMGTEIGIMTDFVKNESEIPVSAKEILVGKTNRSESDIELDGYDYTIRDVNGRIVITGGSDLAVSMAVDYFINTYVTGQNLTIPKETEYMYKFEKIDNSALMPKYVSDDEVIMEPSDADGTLYTPDWAKTLIMMEVHIETATPEGTFQAAVKLLDHCAEMGVNGIWLTPIYEKGIGGNGYGNVGPHRVEPALTGTTDQEKGWEVVKWFVDEAHKRNIRVILDVITWGTVTAAPLYQEKPEWFSGEAWGNQAFNWKNEELREWFTQICVENILKTGADGYRCDCEPNYTGYDLFADVRARLLEQGRKIIIISEDGSKRQAAYDFEQDGVLNYIGWDRGSQYVNPKKFYIDEFNIVDSVKAGTAIGEMSLQRRKRGGQYRFYTYCVSNHDFQRTIVNKNRLVLGYQAIFAPFIPLWYFGEEIGMQAENIVIYHVLVDWKLLDDIDNVLFFEDIKKMIRIRLTYPEIFTYYPLDHRETNICKVTADGLSLQAYARYAGNKGILIVPNNDGEDAGACTITIPYAEMGLSGYSAYTLTDLMTGTVIAEGTQAELASFSAFIAYEHMGVYLVEGKDSAIE